MWVDYYYDREEAYRVVRFIENQLCHTEGEFCGRPFILEWWQKRLVLKLFGWKRRDTGARKYRSFFLFVPRKNGKTAFGSILASVLLYADREESPQIISAAADKEQASYCFNMTSKMVEANPRLAGRSEIYKKSIFNKKNYGSYKVLSKRPNTKHGGNVHGGLIDELHAIEDRELVDVIVTSGIARKQPLFVFMTTAGFDKTHFCYELYNYAKRVAENPDLDPSWLVAIFEADPNKWEDPEEWKKANPNFGVTMDLESFKVDFGKAKEISSYENTFKRLRLNIWTEADVRAIVMDEWDRCYWPDAPRIVEMEDRPCFFGLDLASTTDFAGGVLLFTPTEEQPFYDVFPYYWFPEANVKERKKRLGAIDIEPWISAGFIKLTPGNVIDYDVIRKDVNALCDKYNVREVAIDRWNATQLSTQLDGDGRNVVPIHQGFATMSDATKQLLAIVKKGNLNHRKHPILRWNAANLALEVNHNEDMRPSKKKAKERTDGMVALIMALSRALVHKQIGSVYDNMQIATT